MSSLVKILALIAAAAFVAQAEAATDKIVCYFGSWSTYRNGNGKFSVENINPHLCTHLIYTFVGINGDGSINILDRWNEIDLGAMRRFNDLKKQNPKLKTLIAIGGWNEGSLIFTKVVSNDRLMENFANSALLFMQEHGFDGFDLDWEYPARRGGAATDKVNFSKMLKLFRKKFDETGKKYLLTAAVAGTGTAADLSYEVPALNEYLDFVNLMAYDFHGSYDGVTGQNGPLYPSNVDLSLEAKERCVQASVEAWLARGLSPEKLVLGMGVYGRTFTLSNQANNRVGAPVSNAGHQGPYTMEAGMMGYNEICEKILQGGWTEVWDEKQQVPYMYKGDQWVGYDNPKSIHIKVDYAKSLGLGGLMIWSVETDDFKGICGSKNPIQKEINSALDKSIPEEPEVPSTTQTPKPEPQPTQPPTTGTKCSQEGYMRDPTNCAVFYYCKKNGSYFIQSEFKCAGNLVFDLDKLVCNYPSLVNC